MKPRRGSARADVLRLKLILSYGGALRPPVSDTISAYDPLYQTLQTPQAHGM